ncbi:MAG TPA: lactate utilization protein [Candidatus Margulisiibacteriota bacterium]|nr:lactate utilization protein [Candidatus Margulisiibacteriota bacterium]
MQDKRIDILFKNWQKRNIAGIACENKGEALKMALEVIPLSASIGLSGSVTLDQLGLVKQLEERGNRVFNQYKPGLSREESLELRRRGSVADYFLTSANAISESGELIFLSANGHRISGIANAKNVLVISGVNKLASNLDEAIKRGREYATPLNCKRLNWPAPCLKDGVCRNEICLFPEYKRMCCQLLIIEAEVASERLKVILINETLGY